MVASNLNDVQGLLAAAETQLTISMTKLAIFEYFLCVEERRIFETLTREDSLILAATEGPNHAALILDLRCDLAESRQVRAEARDDLEIAISKLSTTRLRALNYRKDFFYHQEARTTIPSPLPPWVSSISVFIHNIQRFPLVLDEPEPGGINGHVCLMCNEKSESDPKPRGNLEPKAQLLAYTHECCKTGPYHVHCLLSWMLEDEDDPEPICPGCVRTLGHDFLAEIMERRVVELGTL